MTKKLVQIGLSARHVHISLDDLEVLYGAGARLTPFRELYQPGYYAAEETVDLVTEKGALKKVRILGPERKKTQVEVAVTDAMKLGISVPVRESGDLAGSPGLTLVGPKGSVTLPAGVIAASRHIHIGPAEATAFGIKDGDYVRVKCGNANRALIFESVLVRVQEGFLPEMHIDTDEANAALVKNGDLAEIV